MTNGEKLVKAFPDIELYKKMHGGIQIDFDSAWWNAEYKEPTNKNDLGVDREQLKNMIRGLTKWYVKRDNAEVGQLNTAVGLLYDDVMFGIDRLPSVTPQEQRWIPVSERLPEPFSFVDCTCHSLIDDREDWVVETCYLPQPHNSPYSDWGNIPMLNSGECEVIAWMYRDIPNPYKAETEAE